MPGNHTQESPRRRTRRGIAHGSFPQGEGQAARSCEGRQSAISPVAQKKRTRHVRPRDCHTHHAHRSVSGERATRSARHKSARNETLQLCVCAAASVFRVRFSVSVAQRGIPVPFARCPFLVAGRHARVMTRDGARSSLRTYVHILFQTISTASVVSTFVASRGICAVGCVTAHVCGFCEDLDQKLSPESTSGQLHSAINIAAHTQECFETCPADPLRTGTALYVSRLSSTSLLPQWTTSTSSLWTI